MDWRKLIHIFVVALTLSVFGNDLLGDTFHSDCHQEAQGCESSKLDGNYDTTSRQDDHSAPCAACACPMHGKVAVPFAIELSLPYRETGAFDYAALIQHLPAEIPVAIDHPPQLG